MPEYDFARHILMRQWLAGHQVDIVDFLRQHVPKVRAELGRDLLIEVANPHAQAEAAVGSYSPTRRALAAADLAVLERFAETSERFTYEAEQPVSWVRSLDDTHWEARRQHEPQRAHRSWINRTIGDGAWTETDRGPEGHAFGPFMELWDDGAIYLWCYKRALRFLEENALFINGVSVFFQPESVGSVCRMAGRVAAEDLPAVLAGAARKTDVESSTTAAPLVVNCRFEKRPRGPFWHPAADQTLSAVFHRASGRSSLVVKLLPGGGEVRAWGDNSLLTGFSLNGIPLTGFRPWNGGFRTRISAADTASILRLEDAEAQESSSAAPTPAPAPIFPPQPSDVTAGAKIYSPPAVGITTVRISPSGCG